MNCHNFLKIHHLRAQKVLKFEFPVEAIIVFVKNIKIGIEWYVHFIGNTVM